MSGILSQDVQFLEVILPIWNVLERHVIAS